MKNYNLNHRFFFFKRYLFAKIMGKNGYIQDDITSFANSMGAYKGQNCGNFSRQLCQIPIRQR